ncbi:hypothetical protein BE04_15055 [Sorangium cellulosum]|uniref:Uncharacterized protein n=1 Tax=Sorangium cellulosum TaxID=56 RepID=A0A150PWQ9_SORCE|nr:hypothetical protein BE04_15055 [Sorangium cellulosum]
MLEMYPLTLSAEHLPGPCNHIWVVRIVDVDRSALPVLPCSLAIAGDAFLKSYPFEDVRCDSIDAGAAPKCDWQLLKLGHERTFDVG